LSWNATWVGGWLGSWLGASGAATTTADRILDLDIVYYQNYRVEHGDKTTEEQKRTLKRMLTRGKTVAETVDEMTPKAEGQETAPIVEEVRQESPRTVSVPFTYEVKSAEYAPFTPYIGAPTVLLPPVPVKSELRAYVPAPQVLDPMEAIELYAQRFLFGGILAEIQPQDEEIYA
jgi:hypothetical protein